jgi:hypothetical protein
MRHRSAQQRDLDDARASLGMATREIARKDQRIAELEGKVRDARAELAAVATVERQRLAVIARRYEDGWGRCAADDAEWEPVG